MIRSRRVRSLAHSVSITGSLLLLAGCQIGEKSFGEKLEDALAVHQSVAPTEWHCVELSHIEGGLYYRCSGEDGTSRAFQCSDEGVGSCVGFGENIHVIFQE